jgi:hypothetical protein
LNPRRQSLLEKQQQREQEEIRKQEQFKQQKQSKMMNRSGGESKLTQPAAKRACLNTSTGSNSASQRRIFPPQIIGQLEKYFRQDAYLKETHLDELMKSTNLSDKQIKAWFKQRRFRLNKFLKHNRGRGGSGRVNSEEHMLPDYDEDEQNEDEFEFDGTYDEGSVFSRNVNSDEENNNDNNDEATRYHQEDSRSSASQRSLSLRRRTKTPNQI